MARAKRTHRAEARRRYRNEQALADRIEDEDIDEPDTSATRESVSSSKASSPSTPARPSVSNSFRAAFRPLDIRSDLRALPQLVRNKALWIPVALTLATTVAFIVIRPEGRTDVLGILTVFMYQYFVVTPAIGGVFIAGFLAPQRVWLYGVIVGLVAADLLLVPRLARLHRRRPEHEHREPGTRRRAGVVPALPDHRRLLRVDRGVVSTVPVPVEPEPWPRTWQRPASTRRPKPLGEPEGMRPTLGPADASQRGPCCFTPAGPSGAPAAAATSGSARISYATRFTTDPSRCSSPSTNSRAWRRTTPRSRSQVFGHSVTLTMPGLVLEGQEDRALGRHRVLTGHDEPADPDPARPPIGKRRVGHRPQCGPARRGTGPTTWRFASTPSTA